MIVFLLFNHPLIFSSLCPPLCWPIWTPLPLLPKAVSGVGGACWHHTGSCVSSRRGRGETEMGRKRRTGKAAPSAVRGASYTRQAEGAFMASLFCNCPNGSVSSAECRLLCETRLDVRRRSHISTLSVQSSVTKTQWGNVLAVWRRGTHQWDFYFVRVKVLGGMDPSTE